MSAGGGGGGTPLKVLFEILGIDVAKSQLQSLIPEVEKIGTAAETTGSRMKVLGDSLKESGNAGQALSPIVTNLEGIEAANVKATTSVTDLTKATKDEIKAVGELDTVGKEHITTQEDMIKGSQDLVKSEEKSATTKEDLVRSTEKLNTEVDESSRSTDKASQSQDKLEKSSNETTGAINKEEKSIKTLGSEAQKGGQNMNKLENETKTLGVAAETAGKKNEGLKANMTVLMGSTASLAGGITSLWQSYDSLGDAQLRTEKSSLMVSRAQEAYEKATTKVNQLVAEGKTGTEEYSAALLDQEQASTKLNVAKGAEINSQEDLNIANAEFYQNIGPQLISVFGSLATGITAVATTAGGFKTKIAEMAGDFMLKLKGMQTGAVGLSGTLRAIGLTNPFFIAITIGAGLITAFVTNLFGFRDAVNGVGVALGNAIGPLKPFLTMIGDLGKGLVDMLGMGGDAEKAFADTTEETMGTSAGALEGVGSTATTTLGSLKQFGIDLTGVFVDSTGKVQNFSIDYSNALSLAGNATGVLPTATKAAVDKSITYLGSLTERYKQTRAELVATFGKTIDLGDNIKLSGIGVGDKNTASNLGKEISDREKNRSPSILNIPAGVMDQMKKMTEVTTFFSGETGKLHINLGKLQQAFIDLGISETDGKKIIDTLRTSLSGVTEEASRNLSGIDTLDAAALNYSNTLKTGIGTINVQKASMAGLSASFTGVTSMLANSGAAWGLQNQAMLTNNGIVTTATGLTQQNTGVIGENAAATEENATAQKNAATSVDNYAQAEARLATDFATAGLEQQHWNAITSDAGLLAATAALGVMKQQTAMKQQQATLIETVSGLNEYNIQLGKSEGKVTAMAAGMAKQLDVLVKSKVEYWENVGALKLLIDQLATGEPQAIAFSNAFVETMTAAKNAQIELAAVKGETAALTELLVSGEAQVNAYNKGLAEQERQIKLDIIANEELEGKLQGLKNQWASGEAQITSFNNGLINQAIAFEDQKKSIMNTFGAIVKMRQEYADGKAVFVAYQQGLTDTAKAFEDQKLAIESNRASLAQIQRQQEAYSGSLVSFNEGFTQTELEMANAKQTTDALVGSFTALLIKIYEGEAGAQAYKDGWAESSKTFLDSIVAVDKLRGSLDSMKARMPVEQVNAFANGIQQMRQQLMQVEIATANTYGQIQVLQDTIGKGADATIRFNSGFADGYKSIVDWAAGLDTARGSVEGSATAFAEMQKRLGIDLPAGFNLSQEAAQEWIEISEGVPETMNNIVDAANQAGEALLSSLVEGMRGGTKSLEEEFDKLEEKLGIELSDAMKNALKPGIFAQSTKQYLEEEFAALQGMGSEIGGEGWQQMADAMMMKMSAAIQKSPHLAAAGQKVIEAIQAAKLDPGGTQAIADLGKAIQEFGNLAGGSVKPTEQFNAAASNSEGITKQANALDGAARFMLAYNEAIAAGATASEALAAGNNAAAKALTATGTEATGASTGMDAATTSASGLTTEADATYQKMNILAQALGLLGPATSVAVGQANTAWQKLNPTQPQFTNNMNLLAKSLALLPAATAQVVTKANASWTQMGTVSSRIFSTLSTSSKTAASQVNSALASMASRASSSFSTISTSAGRAVSSVRSLISIINALRSKTITLTTIHRDVYQTVYAAKGFGPAVVSSPMNLTVGEAGKELVSVIPLGNNRGRAFDHSAGGSSITTTSTYSTIKTGNRNNISSTLNNSNSLSSSANSISGTTINRFNEAVSRITNTFEKQESIMNASYTTGINSIRNGAAYSSNPTTIGGNTVNSMMTNNVPSYNTVNRRISSSNVFGGGGSGLDAGSIIAMVKDIITQAMSNTTINLNNVTNVDGDVVYNSQKKRFGLNNGSMLK